MELAIARAAVQTCVVQENEITSKPPQVGPQQTEDWVAVLSALLRGETVAWQDTWEPERITDMIRYHGIALALVEGDSDLSAWPASALKPVREEARLQALWEASHREMLVRVLDALAKEGIETRLLKGAAVAYLAYETPAVRRRGDSDLLVRPGREQDAERVLRGLGLKPEGPPSFGQQNWVFDTGMGFRHAIDLHWRLVGSPYLCSVLDEVAFWGEPVALPRLCVTAQTVPQELLMLRGLINQALHATHGYYHDGERVHEGERLIWLMDLALLMRRFAPADWERLVAAATKSGLVARCLAGMQRAAALLDAPLPQSIAAQLAAASGPHATEHYLTDATLGERVRKDFVSLDRWSDRLQLIRRHAFPDAQSLRNRYPENAHWPLIMLYAKRMLGALSKRLTRRR